MGMRKIMVTAAQIIAMREATMRDNGSYELTTAKGQTINALTRAGVVVEGTRFLTVQGVSIYHSVCQSDVIASKGYRTSVSDDVDSLALFTLPAPETAVVEPVDVPMGNESNDVPNVSVRGAEGFDMIPDMSVLTGECYYGCGRPVTGMFCDYVGRTEGVCDLDRSQLGDHITVTPVDPAIWGGRGDDVPTVCVVQNTPGMAGRSHYHAPGCRDITREMKRYGQKQSDVIEFSFKNVAEILTFEYGDIASDNFQPETPEWWAEVMHNAQIDASDVNGFGVKIMPCLDIPAGRVGDSPLIITDGFYRAGFDRPSPERVAEIRAEIDAHSCDDSECITCMVRDMNREEMPSVEEFPNERAYKSGTENANDYVRDAGLEMYGEEWQNTFRSSYALSMEIQAEENIIPAPCAETYAKLMGDDTDGGFVETLVTKEYELSVLVDDVTGTRVSLGWVTLTMNAAQCMDFDRVAEEYGRTQNTRTPRHGWASIITVHDVADI
jgi:hypothetical protein